MVQLLCPVHGDQNDNMLYLRQDLYTFSEVFRCPLANEVASDSRNYQYCSHSEKLQILWLLFPSLSVSLDC